MSDKSPDGVPVEVMSEAIDIVLAWEENSRGTGAYELVVSLFNCFRRHSPVPPDMEE